MNSLYLKHLLVTSPMGGILQDFRTFMRLPQRMRHPELGLLSQEDKMIETRLAALLSATSNCVDVGAHIGSMSYLFHKLSPQGQHHIIEASPTKAAWLQARFPDSVVHQKAVSDQAGSVSFYENIDKPGFSSLTDRSGRGETRKITVDCVLLDDLLVDMDALDLLKIDVEGHEYSALKGAQKTLERLRPVILFEAGAATDADIDNATYVALFDFLTGSLEYDVFPVFGLEHNRAPLTQEGFDFCRTYPFLAFNFFAVPRTART